MKNVKKAQKSEKKKLIGILVDWQSLRRHNELVSVLNELVDKYESVLQNFAFAMTGGTFRRVIEGKGTPDDKGREVEKETKKFLLKKCGVVRLPRYDGGGVVYLAHLIVQRRMSILWPFFSPTTPHWLQPESVALMRLCDYYRVNRLLNAHSVQQWFPEEAVPGLRHNQIDWPPDDIVIPSLNSKKAGTFKFALDKDGAYRIQLPKHDEPRARVGETRRLALIAHDHLKDRMVDFAIDYECELDEQFDKIITTGTTGARIREAAPRLAEKIHPYHSGPKGGDIEIATEIMLGLVDCVIFFVDPLHPHPHTDDIRVVFGACLMMPVRMLTNERQAREWMDRHSPVPP